VPGGLDEQPAGVLGPGSRDRPQPALAPVSSGKVIASQLVPASGGYNSVAAARGGFFAAVGSAQGAGSEVTTG
jgi:hypothetical protein